MKTSDADRLLTATMDKRRFDHVTVYTVSHPGAVPLVTGRDTVGPERVCQYKRALVQTLAFGWPRVAEEEGIGGSFPLVSLRRGGDWIRPDGLDVVMDMPVLYAGLKARRYLDTSGKWQVRIDESGSAYLDRLSGAKKAGGLDECMASGATPAGVCKWIFEHFHECEKLAMICPFVGDIALLRLIETVDKPLAVFTLGVFKTVREAGWGGEPQTDIVVPSTGFGTTGLVSIPDLYRKAYEEVYGYGPNGDGMCVAGNASDTLDANERVQLLTLVRTSPEWLVRNFTNPTEKLWQRVLALLNGIPELSGATVVDKRDAMVELVGSRHLFATDPARRGEYKEMCQKLVQHLGDIYGTLHW